MFEVELKFNYLSFKILKVQRNKYITSLMVYAALAVNAYIWLLNYMYDKREQHEKVARQQVKDQGGREEVKG